MSANGEKESNFFIRSAISILPGAEVRHLLVLLVLCQAEFRRSYDFKARSMGKFGEQGGVGVS